METDIDITDVTSVTNENIKRDDEVKKTKETFKKYEINVSGSKFEVSEETYVKVKKSIPDEYKDDILEMPSGLYVERHATAFQCILYYQMCGELHLPSEVCPSAFKRELEFWGVSELALAKCCFAKYMGYFDDDEILKILEADETARKMEARELMSMSRLNGWRSIQGHLWLVLNEPFYSISSKVYFFVSALVIILSLFALIAGTHSTFQRSLNENEWKIYFGDEWPKYEHLIMGTNPDTSSEPEDSGSEVTSDPEASSEPEVMSEPESTAEPEVTSEPEATSEPEVTSEPEATSEPEVTSEPEATSEPEVTTEPEGTSEPEVTTEPEATTEPEVTSEPESNSEPEVTSEPETTSEPEVTSEPSTESEPEAHALPENAYARFSFLDIIEYISIAFFTIDLCVRFVFCPYRSSLLTSFLNWVDIFSLLVMYLKYGVEIIHPREKYEASVMDILHCLQVVRVFRLFRLVKNFLGFRVLYYAFKASVTELLLMSMFLLVATLLFATFAYFSGDDNFPSIPDSFWWAIITMTTVGYGDIVPKLALSKTIGVFCAVCGVCLIAVVVPIFVNNFMLFYTYSKVWGKRSEVDNAQNSKVSPVTQVESLQQDKVNCV
ncbi:Potassium voltage-gated channel [Mactra antiquata]